ncbi:MAG: tetratricopeptide repeat protein, partial [Runella zeae]
EGDEILEIEDAVRDTDEPVKPAPVKEQKKSGGFSKSLAAILHKPAVKFLLILFVVGGLLAATVVPAARYFLLNTAGVWRFQQLIDQPQIKSPSMVKQYLGFLMQHINHAEKSIDEYAEGYMRKKGLVNRGPGLTAPLMVSPQFESNLENETVTFLWKSKPRTTSYTFAIYDDWNANADPIFVKEIPDTSLQVSMDKALLESDRLYYWSVVPQNTTQSIRYAFKRLKNDDLKKFEEKLIALQTDLKFNKAMNAFLKAGLYEENYFYPEANRQFLNALELEPKNQLFRQSYALFLARHGQLDDAKKYLNM